jgi:hypothetical protein
MESVTWPDQLQLLRNHHQKTLQQPQSAKENQRNLIWYDQSSQLLCLISPCIV